MTKHTVQLSDDLYERVKVLAASTGRSLDDLIRDALVELLEDAEDVRLIAQHEASEKTAPVTLDEMRKRLGMDH